MLELFLIGSFEVKHKDLFHSASNWMTLSQVALHDNFDKMLFEKRDIDTLY